MTNSNVNERYLMGFVFNEQYSALAIYSNIKYKQDFTTEHLNLNNYSYS